MHTASSESFFPASTYHKDALDKDGNVDITKFPVNDVSKKQKTWTCVSGLCKLDDKPEIASNVSKIYNSIGECDPIEARHYIRVIPYHFTKLLHMTPSELNEIWCVGSPSSLMYPKRVSPKLLVWLPRNALLNIFLFCSFAKHVLIQSIIT